jgi:hypothetical protein
LIGTLSSFSYLTAAAEVGTLEIKDYQGVAYVSGGVGEEEREFLRTVEKHFNLKLVFALTRGNYLSDINIDIRDARNLTVLEAVSDGPLFYADLAPGTYKVRVSGPGQSFQRSVRLSRGKRVQLEFYWR